MANAGQPDAPLPGSGDARLFLGKMVRSMQSGYASLGEDGG